MGQNKTVLSKSEEVILLDSVVIEGNRALEKTPVSFTELSKERLRSVSPSSSLPMILNLQPSVVSLTEGGTGLGYSKMSVRGSDPSRINVTLNGVAMNDSESQEVFWVNIPSLGGFLQNVQLQRGVGTSVNGPGAFGASINMQTLFSPIDAYGEAESGFGSYHTFTNSIGAGSGRLENGLSFDLKVNRSSTKGYIRNAKADLLSVFASVGYLKNRHSLRLNYIMGDQISGITWEGNPSEMLSVDRRYNPSGKYYDDAGNVKYYDNETDNYRQHYFQALYTYQFSPVLYLVNTLNYTKGDGYYENYKADKKFSSYGVENQIINGVEHKRTDVIIRQAMDNNYYVATSTLKYRSANQQSSLGLSYSMYDGDHFGYIRWSKFNANIPEDHQWYLNNGKKHDFSVFLRSETNVGKNFLLYADIQYRHLDYRLSGPDKDFVLLDKELKYDFFNPKVGVTYNTGKNSRLYLSLAVGHKEPSRGDIKEAIKAGRSEQMKPERLLDWEAGYSYNGQIFAFSANLYFMEYKNQLVQTGKLSETGYGIKENVPVSYRRGIELAGAFKLSNRISIDANTTLSLNKIKDYTAWVDTYDLSGNFVQVAEHYENTTITMSPSVISMLMLSYTPFSGASISLNGKYVGKQYYDNTSNEQRVIPSYFVSGLNVSYKFFMKGSSTAEISLFVDNLLNNKYIAGGWRYQINYMDGSAPYIEDGFFPQAGTNYILRLIYRF